MLVWTLITMNHIVCKNWISKKMNKMKFITFLRFITISCRIDNIFWNISHIQIEWGIFVEYCESHETMLWTWILLCWRDHITNTYFDYQFIHIFRNYNKHEKNIFWLYIMFRKFITRWYSLNVKIILLNTNRNKAS